MYSAALYIDKISFSTKNSSVKKKKKKKKSISTEASQWTADSSIINSMWRELPVI